MFVLRALADRDRLVMTDTLRDLTKRLISKEISIQYIQEKLQKDTSKPSKITHVKELDECCTNLKSIWQMFGTSSSSEVDKMTYADMAAIWIPEVIQGIENLFNKITNVESMVKIVLYSLSKLCKIVAVKRLSVICYC